MNAVEIEEALSQLASDDFNGPEFPYAFLAAFGAKETTLKRLRKGETNASDIPGGLLWRNNIHIAVCEPGTVAKMIQALRVSPKTAQGKAKFILATDGEWFEAEDLASGEHLPCAFKQFADHFGFFLPLAGISTVKELKDNPVDVRATGRLNKLYVELLGNNPEWAKAGRRHDMNHFMARLIFCYFAEDTDIFLGASLFTRTIDQMTQSDGSNVHEVLETIFRAMNMSRDERSMTKLPGWAQRFPYVNGGLFSGSTDVPTFTRASRSYLIRAGELDWKEINPDIFGSMIQAVADDDERGALGMHYTSVPNILKVLNPLFLDDLRAQLHAAAENKAKLLNLRKRMSRIRVFDPACGSGNFLVIAYKKMRELEAEINRRRGEPELKSEIPLTNFRGIELRSFPAEIARLALIIAEFQSDVLYRGQKEALAEVLPLDSENWITCDNALRLDWLKLMDADAAGVELVGDDLFNSPTDQAAISFENEAGETFICGNPPYVGRKYQTDAQKAELKAVFRGRSADTLSLDYVTGWLMKAADYISQAGGQAAFVTTNSICQGIQVPALWPAILEQGSEIKFAYQSFNWSNLAARNAGVSVAIIGLSSQRSADKALYSVLDDGSSSVRTVENISPYLVPGANVFVAARSRVPDQRTPMQFGNHPYYANALMLSPSEARDLVRHVPSAHPFIRPLYGSKEFISGTPRSCIWIDEADVAKAMAIPEIRARIDDVGASRSEKVKDTQAKKLADAPYRFRDQYEAKSNLLIVPIVSSENRPFLPIGLLGAEAIIHNKAFAMYDAPLWNMAVISSRLHWVWIATVCGRLRTDFSYSNTLGWNTFPIPALTDKNKADLNEAAEHILLAREAHFPGTIAGLYDADTMPDELRAAHEWNDEVVERIYIGRRFKNDSERLEKLFDLYTRVGAMPVKTKSRSKTK